MMTNKNKLGITDVVLRDGHQSLLATRMRIDDMLPVAEKLDKIGYWSVESWGGATFDACIRYLGEDPWERIRKLKEVMPNTPQQMLFRGQNILGYRHYADDVVQKFVERAAVNGIDVFRVFDAMNDPRNFETAIKAVIDNGKHAQGAMSYTHSPVHTLELWLTLGKQLQDMGAHSICIKDMAGLLKPYDAYELVLRLKKELEIPIHLHSHATTGLSTATLLKAIEAGVDNVDTSISSMSATYGHSATESIVAMLENQTRDTGLDIAQLESIAAELRVVRKKYSQFEGSLKGIDSRILVAQVPGGMLTNMENQLKEQGASDKLDQVLEEIPRVRKELGYIPLVTPTSQIVGTQAVLNVLSGERYKTVTKETTGILKGEYGATPGKLDASLQARILGDTEVILCRPADKLESEVDKLTNELTDIASKKEFKLANAVIDDVLTYALFPQVGLKFLENRDNPAMFEPIPTLDKNTLSKRNETQDLSDNENYVYTVTVAGNNYVVQVSEGGDIIKGPVAALSTSSHDRIDEGVVISDTGEPVAAPLSGQIFKILVNKNHKVVKGDVIIILEAMKMETEIRAGKAGIISDINVREGDAVSVGEPLFSMVYN
ncbi:MAG: sodium-extruding oxaloacetate decarboxylase subunit alpha [gamma proteobacterium symbiont of Bathyaustriella thionipta]|nr:sodium-extruding oxaloacetate decarboxylase subunit alpha [gamma proteobacterium symbiont of Bathyaustriella thionipta]MCU7951091.1 sodium-extruding oxaloacetate decarboxylase subunit alpha [gamma proteobacterium symbiont of Bathyaustriella thionipta]MCU7952016.1 sodium-extruding oxaloacetate decarboxylase subunit alpha [gamma proteobacterium symbiont of Bathyaustriella thionipta]MCU7957602.1 sodium-extruding oxaloacetate decarboxylase subunit alpha [gamma proteobacterium symbiont of Bathyaus